MRSGCTRPNWQGSPTPFLRAARASRRAGRRVFAGSVRPQRRLLVRVRPVEGAQLTRRRSRSPWRRPARRASASASRPQRSACQSSHPSQLISRLISLSHAKEWWSLRFWVLKIHTGRVGQRFPRRSIRSLGMVIFSSQNACQLVVQTHEPFLALSF